MKIIIIGASLENNHGGPSQIFVNLANSLVMKWGEKKIIPLSIENSRKLISYLNVIYKIIFLPVDIIHVHSGNLVPFLLALLPIKIRQKIILTQHGFQGFDNGLKGLKKKIYINGTIFTFKRFNNITFVSNLFYNHIKPFIPRNKKIFIIPNGLSAGVINVIESEGTVTNNFIFIGNLHYVKGLDKFLSVLIKYKYITELTIIGKPGNAYNRILNLIDSYKKIGGKVKLFDALPQREVFKELQKNRFCIIPSRFDSFNNVVLEAMYLKNVVICSNNVGASMIIKHGKNGLLYKNENELIKVLNDIKSSCYNFDNIAKNAQNSVQSYFWDTIAQQYYSVYERVNDELAK